jgi:predicted DNA-binding transcriptional regulator AlpA
MSLEHSPRKKIIGTAKVCEKTDNSPRTISRLVQKGLFPKPFYLPGLKKRCWLELTIDQHIDQAAKGEE